jgi:hypothetical protein
MTFGVAAALEIEDALVGPAVLVVADERAVRIGRERGLARAGEPKEQRGLAVLALIGRAVHGQDALLGQQIIQQREDRFFDLPGVSRAADEDNLFRQMQNDKRLGARAVAFGDGAKRRGTDHSDLRVVPPSA